jgi:hypothetical protein
MRVDTSSQPYDGILEMWADGNQVFNATNVDFNVDLNNVFTHVLIGSNKQNASDGWTDYDDFAFSETAMPPCL